MQINKKIFSIVVFLTAIAVAFSVSGAVVVTVPPEQSTIHNGIYINNIDVGGLTKEAALHKLTRAIQPGLYDFKLKYGKRYWKYGFAQLGLKPQFSKTINSAFALGREANVLTRYITIFKLKSSHANLPTAWTVDRMQGQAVLQKIGEDINQLPVNAKVTFVNSEIKVQPEKAGYRLQVADSLKAVARAVNQGKLTSDLIVEKVVPPISVATLKEVKDELAVAVTSLDGDDKERQANIKLAAKFLNNAVVEPGQTFSFNAQVGLRTTERGFKKAPVIDNQKIVEGIGGGVCQTSSTLYQAVLLAGGLEVTERHAHSLAVDYVPLGQDATVADKQLDLKFKNTRSQPVLIVAYVSDEQLVVRIIGKQELNENGQKVKLISETVETLEPQLVMRKDATLQKGVAKVVDPGATGYRVKLYRLSTKPTGETIKKLVASSYYEPQKKVIKVGTKENIKLGRHK